MGNYKHKVGLFFSVVAITLASLAGCGQKGPLYLPDETQQQEKEKEKEKKKQTETQPETEAETTTDSGQ
jgi:predicted small lipoprotein YifL